MTTGGGTSVSVGSTPSHRPGSGWRRRSACGAAWLLALVLGAAGVGKAGDPPALARAVENFRLVGESAAQVAGYYLPWLEIVLAVGLLLPRWRHPAAGVALVLLTGFTVALASADWRGIDLACGCFGSWETSIRGGWVYLRNAVLLALAAWVAWGERVADAD